jgi:3-oxoacyl-[acyl-carrier protein] reductase
VSSVWSWETYGIYAATKSAVETLTGILSKELRGRSITVNAVAPGPTATALFLDGKSPELIERMSKMNPLERLGTPEDIAAAVAFLVGPDGSWINGQVLRANGGMVWDPERNRIKGKTPISKIVLITGASSQMPASSPSWT